MSTTSRFVSIGAAMALALAIGGAAQGQLSKDDQKCIDGYNNKLRLVGQQAGKDYRTCIKNAGKGAEPNPDGCVTADTPGKIAGKVTKVNELFLAGGKCDPVPAVIVQGASTGSNAMIDASQDLVRDVFGDPISGVVSPPKADAKCQDKAYQRAEQLFTEKLKTFRKCKKDAMKAGTVTDEASLEAQCATPTIPDPAGKIAGKTAKLLGDVNAACAALSLGTLFPGDCSSAGTTAALGTCIEARVECRVCEALNAADGLSIDCDLFDDGVGNGSCGLALHKCVLDTTPATDSELNIYIQALPIPLVFGMVGAVDIGGGGTTSVCEVQSIDPINIPSIGFVCISPSSTACPAGTRYCGPGAPGSGPALGIDVQSDGNTGACASEAACDASCVGFCAPGAVASSGCTGFCSGGTNPACTNDAMCLPNDGACNGPDPVAPAQANICQCSCVNTAAGGGSDPGDMQCNLGSSLMVENAAPCGDGDIKIAVGDSCIPLSTQSATGVITDANFIPGQLIPTTGAVTQTGAPLACATVDASTTTGLVSVGHVNFFGSSLGDLAVTLKTTCQ